MSYDKFNAKKDRLYFVRENQKYDTYTATFGSTPGVLGPAIQAEIPGIANTCRMTEDDSRLLFQVGNKSIYAFGKYGEPSVFDMFTLPFADGDPKTALTQIHSIVLTEDCAKKIFGEEKGLIGKTIRIDNKQDYVVRGVLKNIPENSSLRFEWVDAI